MTLDINDMYQKYFDTMVFKSISMVGSMEIAKDVAQETMIKAWLNQDKYDPKYSVYTWLINIAKNTSIDHIRKENSSRFIRDENEPIWNNFRCPCQNIETIDLETNLNKIRIKYRFTLYQVYIIGHTHKEVAEKFSMTLGEVKNNISMGLKELRKIYT